MTKSIIALILIISVYTVNCYERKNLCPELVFKVGRGQVNGYYQHHFYHGLIDGNDAYLFDKNLKPYIDKDEWQEPDKSFFNSISKFNDLAWDTLDEGFLKTSSVIEMKTKQDEMKSYVKTVNDFSEKLNSKYQALYDEAAAKINKTIDLVDDIIGLKKGLLIDTIFFDDEYLRGIVYSMDSSLKEKDLNAYKNLQILVGGFSCRSDCRRKGGSVNIRIYVPVYYKYYDEDDIHCDEGTVLPPFYLQKKENSSSS